MWTLIEHKRFQRATFLISTANYQPGLKSAQELLLLIGDKGPHRAYVLGCKVAVALRHVGRTEEALQAFKEAARLARDAGEDAILSYILCDFSSMFPTNKAKAMVDEADKLCRKAQTTPDPERAIDADRAYIKATLARYLAAEGHYERALAMLERALRTLKQHAYGNHPAYKHAYLVVLMWEREIIKKRSLRYSRRRFNIDRRVAAEVVRQHKVIAMLKVLGRMLIAWLKNRLMYP